MLNIILNKPMQNKQSILGMKLIKQIRSSYSNQGSVAYHKTPFIHAKNLQNLLTLMFS